MRKSLPKINSKQLKRKYKLGSLYLRFSLVLSHSSDEDTTNTLSLALVYLFVRVRAQSTDHNWSLRVAIRWQFGEVEDQMKKDR